MFLQTTEIFICVHVKCCSHTDIFKIHVIPPRHCMFMNRHSGGLCHQWGPWDELATGPGSTLPSPRVSWDWFGQKTQRPHTRDKAVTDNRWMDGPNFLYSGLIEWWRSYRQEGCQDSDHSSLCSTICKHETAGQLQEDQPWLWWQNPSDLTRS